MSVDNDQSVTDTSTFASIGLNAWLADQCKVLGMRKPSPVQTSCIPEILKGRDCIGCAKTGSGKTAAFALPILQELSKDPYGVFALVLTPTRELAIQISEQFHVFGKPMGVKCITVVGGISIIEQGLKLTERPHIVVATPGRLADHIDNAGFTFRGVKFLVLDEADRLLSDSNFKEQLLSIFSSLPDSRQTLLFSATITDALLQLRRMAMREPFFWQSESSRTTSTVEHLDQKYVLMPAQVKDGYLVRIISLYQEQNPTSSAVIFTNTCRCCQLLSMMLEKLGFQCLALHSLLSQRERSATLARFKSSKVRLLVATDVASRGLDVPGVDLVINYDIPRLAKNYVHRVGRTARAGHEGQALTLVTQHDINLLKTVENEIKIKLAEHKVSEKEVMKILTEVAVTRSECKIKLDENDFGEAQKINDRKKLILGGKSPEEADEILEGKQKRKTGKVKTHDKKSRNNVSKDETESVRKDNLPEVSQQQGVRATSHKNLERKEKRKSKTLPISTSKFRKKKIKQVI